MKELTIVFCVVLAGLATIAISVTHGVRSTEKYITSICGKEEVLIKEKEFATLEISCKVIPKEVK